MRSKINKAVFITVCVSVLTLFMGLVVAVEPNGAIVTPGTPERATADSAGNAAAYAGNITELTLRGISTTQSWQGYFGNVSGAIELADSSGDVLYNWSTASPSGEVFASTNQTITWSNIQCFNFTANGTRGGAGGETAGGTNIGGTNLSQLETEFGIVTDDVDGVNETFSDSNSHAAFFTASQAFSAGECASSDVFVGSGATDGQFEEVLLYEPATSSVIFTALLEQDVSGFDASAHDFEMLVLENGHSGDLSASTYYFFVELE